MTNQELSEMMIYENYSGSPIAILIAVTIGAAVVIIGAIALFVWAGYSIINFIL